MGKGVLIFVLASTLSLSAMYMAGIESDVANATQQSEYQEEILARETATSAYNLLVSKVKRDFEGYRGSYSDLSYGKATYDMSATGADDGSVTVVAVGKYGTKEFEITGTVYRGGDNVLDAVTIMAQVDEVELKNDYLITGEDAGGGNAVHAVKTIWDATVSAFASEMELDQVIGTAGPGDVVKEQPDVTIAAIRGKIEAYNGDSKIFSVAKDFKSKDWAKGKYAWGGNEDGIMGTIDAPVVAHLKVDKAELSGDFTGTGILLVEGDLTMKDNASWNGLVFVAGSESVFKMEKQSTITGAVIMDGIDSFVNIEAEKDGGDDAGLLGGHFDVDVFEEPNSDREIYHQHAYDDKFDTTVLDIFASGCKSGGLCWNQVMGPLALDEVEIVTFNASNSSGTYSIKTNSAEYSGDVSNQVAVTVDPADLTEFKFTFDSLCAMAPSSPSDSQSRPDTRNGAFSVRVFDTSAPGYEAGSTDIGVNSGLVYEAITYWHTKDNSSCGSSSSSSSSSSEDDGLWRDPSGDVYAGTDPVCVSEDDNDLYTDAAERSKKWGSRKYQKGTNGKSSKKWWSPSGECGASDKGKTTKQFIMHDDASITYNSQSLKRLKDIVSEFEEMLAAPVARRLSTASRDRDMVRKMDGTMAQKSSVQ